MAESELCPGEPKAKEYGCLCPEWENTKGYGWGVDKDGDIVYKIHKECPLHKHNLNRRTYEAD